MYFASYGREAKLQQTADYAGSKIWTVGVIAEIFSELFFFAVGSCEARLNCYPRHGKPLATPSIIRDAEAFSQMTLLSDSEPSLIPERGPSGNLGSVSIHAAEADV